jgi:hypothetical protein
VADTDTITDTLTVTVTVTITLWPFVPARTSTWPHRPTGLTEYH